MAGMRIKSRQEEEERRTKVSAVPGGLYLYLNAFSTHPESVGYSLKTRRGRDRIATSPLRTAGGIGDYSVGATGWEG